MSTKINHLKELKELAIQAHRAKHPGYPLDCVYVRPYSDKSETELSRAIIDYLKFQGHFAERINTMGVPVDRRRIVINSIGQKQQIGSLQWRKSTVTRGSADVSAVLKNNGQSLKIECKTKYGSQSADQIKYEIEVTKAGAIYWLVRSFEDFINKYELLTNKLRK